MKRKFSFLAPLRIPSKAENRALKAHLDSHNVTSPLSSPLSLFINRRELDHQTEAQLKAACAAVVKGYVNEPETKLNFKPLHQTKSVPQLNSRNEARSSRPQTSSHVDTRRPPVPAVPSANRALLSSKSIPDFRQINHTPRHDTSHGPQSSKQYEPRHHPTTHVDLRKPSAFSPTTGPYRPKTALIDESDGSYSTPKTGSTGDLLDTISTAFTSTVITPSLPTKYFSNHDPFDQITHAEVKRENDEQVGRSLKQQFEPHGRHSPDYRQSKRPESRSSGRSLGLRPDRKDTAQPNVPVEAKPIQHDSLERISTSHVRSPSHDHVAFNLQQNLSFSDLDLVGNQDCTTTSIERTYLDVAKQFSTLNLNRALPPLPRLDTWGQHRDATTIRSGPMPTTMTAPKTHIANLMKGIEQHPVPSPSLLRAQQATDQSMLPPKDELGYTTGNISKRRSAAHSKSSSTADSCFSSSNRSRAPSGSLNNEIIPENALPPVKSPAASHHTRLSDAPTATSTSTQQSLSREGGVPNFSRKISIDIHSAIRSQTIAEVTALPPMPPQKPRGFRKVLSRFDLIQGSKKLEKQMTWMDHLEAEGIKTGIMLPRGIDLAAAPIVRY